ncbi:hypothetical protein AMJ85_04310 [candidate division BRC1 bacterium SM23_51]|nr:MAG: hypothetical protein AMJ85_04310 [candidate division BRC1 bacterium SM23_51]
MGPMGRKRGGSWWFVGARRALAASIAALFFTSCAELDYLRNKVVIQEQRIRELEVYLRDWQDGYNKLREQKIADDEELKKALKLRDGEITRLRTMRSDKERDLEARVNELRIRLQEALDTNAALDLKMRKDAEAANTRIASQKKELSALRATESQLKKDLAGARSEADTLGKQAEAADRSLRAAQQRVKAVESELEQLKTTLDERNRTINKHEQTIAELRETVKTASETGSKASEELTGVKKQLADEQRLGEAERKKQRAEIARLTSNLAALRSEPSAQDPNLAKAKQELTQVLQEEIKQKTAEVVSSFDRVIVRFQSDVLFERTTVLLRQSARARLGQIAEVLAKYPDYQLRIEGHTDNTPVRNMPFPDNLALSSQRADNVVRFLMEAAKLPQKQIRSSGSSYWLPLASNDTPEGRQRNRRVEIILTHEE